MRSFNYCTFAALIAGNQNKFKKNGGGGGGPSVLLHMLDLYLEKTKKNKKKTFQAGCQILP